VAFHTRVPPARWHLSMLLALIHAASMELRAKRPPAAEVESALVTSVLGALGSRRDVGAVAELAGDFGGG
jgi:hypothetical protein